MEAYDFKNSICEAYCADRIRNCNKCKVKYLDEKKPIRELFVIPEKPNTIFKKGE